jgi:hypothetical protein
MAKSESLREEQTVYRCWEHHEVEERSHHLIAHLEMLGTSRAAKAVEGGR